MKRGMPFWLRLFAAFIIVIVVVAGGVATLAHRRASSALHSYVHRDRTLYALALAPAFETHDPQRGFWQGAVTGPAGNLVAGPNEAEFLRSLNQALLVAVALAGGAALLLALLLSRYLSGPLHTLAVAAGQIATGEPGLRVDIDEGGELGLLGRSLNAMAEALEQQEGSRRQLIADIAHELRTPLAIIRGNLEALLDGIYRPAPETIAPIHEEALLLTRLVDELRDLSLAEAGQLKLHVEPANPAELVRSVLSGFQAQAGERGIELPLVLPATGLPKVAVDVERIRQVLGNLLANALRYAPQRGWVRVTLLQASPNWIQIRVSDNGPGIRAEDLPYVFDRFHHGDRTRGREAGLGLAIAKQWIEAHGGSMRVESAPQRGTTFAFTIPVSKGA